MSNTSNGRGGKITIKARDEKNLQSSSQISCASSLQRPLNVPQDNYSVHGRSTRSPTNDVLTDRMSDLALEKSEDRKESSLDDMKSLDKATERQPPSPPISDLNSDDEIIIFSGRSRKNMQKLNFEGDESQPMEEAGQNLKSTYQDISSPAQMSMGGGVNAYKIIEKRKGEKNAGAKRKQHGTKPKRTSANAEEDAIIADYISNMQSTDGTDDTFVLQHLKSRDLGLEDGTFPVQFLDVEQAEDKGDKIINSQEDWDSTDLQDFDCFCCSSEPLSTPPCILRRRTKNSQVQYLVIAEGEPVDEARWLTENLLTAPGTSDLIKLFEENQLKKTLSTNDDLALSDGNSSQESVEDERDLIERYENRASDEQIARLLSKQAEIGLVGNDLVLFDGDGFDQASRENTVAPAIPSRSRAKSKKRAGSRRSLAPNYSDDRMWDPYDEFDVMDFDRPSLQRSSKRGQLSEDLLNLSDPDLQQSLIAAWKSDRVKKKQRKLERESLRSQGLIGKTKKPEVGKRFKGDRGMEDIKKAVTDFLKSTAPSRPLPPMDHRERKMIHLIAHKSGLKSQSVGSGAARFPVLYRTSHTKTFTPGLEAQINALLTPKTFVSRTERFRGKGIPASRNVTGGTYTAASYRDGEIVGVGAPEIGMENRGRAILEKMGWSNGNSLGAANNKGIAQPIEQIVKTSKAGLG